LAKNFRKKQDFRKLPNDVADLNKRLDSLAVMEELNKKSLQCTRDAIIEERKQTKQKIVETLDKIDKIEIQELNKKVDKLIDGLSNDARRLKKEKQELINLLETSQNNADDSAAFVAYTKCKKKVSIVETFCDAVVKRGQYTVEFHVNHELEAFRNSVRSLGKLEEKVMQHSEHVFKVISFKKNVIKLPKNMRGHSLFNMLELPNGTIVALFISKSCFDNDEKRKK